MLARVAKIEPGSVKSFDEVKDQIKTELAQSQAKGEAQKLHDKIEDLRSAGKTLAQAAEALGLQSQTYVTDAAGAAKGENGQAGRADSRARAARRNCSRRSSPRTSAWTMIRVSRKDGGYSWFEISAVEPSRQLPLDEVKAAVITSLQEGAAQRDLAKKANDLARKIEAGESVAEAAAANGAQAQTAEGVRRGGAPGLSEAAIESRFSGRRSAAPASPSPDRADAWCSRSPTPRRLRSIKRTRGSAKILPQLEASIADDVFAEYVSGLKTSWERRSARRRWLLRPGRNNDGDGDVPS